MHMYPSVSGWGGHPERLWPVFLQLLYLILRSTQMEAMVGIFVRLMFVSSIISIRSVGVVSLSVNAHTLCCVALSHVTLMFQ